MKPAVITGFAVTVLIGGSAAAFSLNGSLHSQLLQRLDIAQPVAAATHTTVTVKAKPKENQTAHTSTSENSATVTPAPATTAQPAATPPKYDTSPDPRSTASSPTPPAPSPASVNITITHAGQVAPGTLITYNPAKDYKVYYGGDLSLSTSSVTIRKTTTNFSADFTVSVPDGAAANLPSLPWN